MRNGVFLNTLILAKPLLKEDAVYCINMDEFWHHSVPYVHKIFVMYLTNLITGSQALIYAKSACPKSDTSTEFLTNSDELADIILEILMQVPIPLRRNIVAIVSDRFRMNIRALTILEDICPYVPPPHVFDVTHLLNYFIKESDISCENNVLLLVDTVFKRQEYRNQLNEIQQRCKSINYDTLALFWAFISSIKETLKNIFQVIDKDEFVLTKLNSDRMEQKGKSFVSHMPVMPLKMCAEGGGLLSFMVYDAASDL